MSAMPGDAWHARLGICQCVAALLQEQSADGDPHDDALPSAGPQGNGWGQRMGFSEWQVAARWKAGHPARFLTGKGNLAPMAGTQPNMRIAMNALLRMNSLVWRPRQALNSVHWSCPYLRQRGG